MAKIEIIKEQKRNAIINAAIKAFLSEGYIGTSMDVIAHQAGVTKQTVYRYFATKEILFQTALESQRKESQTGLLNSLDLVDTKEALTQFALGFLNLHLSESHLASIRLLVSESPSAPEMTKAFFSLGPQETKKRLTIFFEERFKIEDPEYAMKIFTSSLLSMRMNVLIGLTPPPTQEQIHQHAKRTVSLFLKLLET
ncbi:MAG: TetR/AcrR family transcriptional regulator [Spirochaetales bacterium]|nr:TetR/AcrR family transcriptional regulator [Spirochaetales bacterium]